MKSIYNFFLLIVTALTAFSCANQIPPSGGKDDTIPPKIISVYPKPGTLNFRNNYIKLIFDEYIDRRSFEESFYISPRPKGGYVFDWSGKEVEVSFPGKFNKDRTYVVSIGRDLKDVRGSNPAGSVYSFAFSTGSKLDSGMISGKIYSDNYERIKILAYILSDVGSKNPDPEKTEADYILQPDESGRFSFNNLPSGTYRLFAIYDEDRNNLYSKGFDRISVFSEDIILNKDISKINNVNFILKDYGFYNSAQQIVKNLKPDSAGYIYTNIQGISNIIPTDYKFYFYFKNGNFSKSDIVNNLKFTDSESGNAYRMIYNWENDSLLEVFSQEKFKPASVIKIDLKLTEKNYSFSENLSVTGTKNSGIVSGRLISDKIPLNPVFIMLLNTDNKFISFSKKLNDTTDFIFEDVPEGKYILFSFIDKNENGVFDAGNYSPMVFSEEFYVYETEINVKGGWNTDNVFIKF